MSNKYVAGEFTKALNGHSSGHGEKMYVENTYAQMLKKAGKTIPKLGERDMMKAIRGAQKNRPEYREMFVHKEPHFGLDE